MKKISVLSKSNIDLAKQEVLSLANTCKFELIDNLLILDSSKNLYDRLGLSHYEYEFLFKSSIKDIEKKTQEFDWNKIYKENFYVETKGVNKTKEFSSIIYSRLKSPKVKLKNSKTHITFFFKEKKVVVGKLVSEIDKSFLKRKAHLRPQLHPTSLHPGLARACINLSGLKKGKFLDPFCGSGGILIEAGLMGFDVIGYDIDKIQIKRAKQNLEHYKIQEFKLEVKDATKIKGKYDLIVTDLPYGKNSIALKTTELYLKFLKNTEKLTKNFLIIFPDKKLAKSLIQKTNWKIKNHLSQYVHKSMTREIFNLVLSD